VNGFSASKSALLVLISLIGAGRLAGQEWTRFRGPNGSGISAATTIPVKWTEADLNWKVELPGIGHSSPVLWGDRLYITSADKETARQHVLCIDTADGKTIWHEQFESNPFRQHRMNSFASATPVVDADRLYVCSTSDKAVVIRALDRRTGKQVWHRDLGPFDSNHGPGTSPMLYKDLLVLTNDNQGDSFVIAMDCKTGKDRWKVERQNKRKGTSYGTPCVRRNAEGKDELILVSRVHGVTAVDPALGKVAWERDDVFTNRNVSSPVLAGDLIVGSCGSGGGGNYVAALRPNKDKPELVYKITKNAPYVPTTLAHKDLLFLWSDNGVVTCVESASGDELWRERVGGKFFGSPVWVDGRLYCMSHEGEIVILAASREFKEPTRIPLGEGTYATPAIADGRMYLRTFSHLISIGGKSVPPN
jgi:outer membrane protein assembly factor BamB